MVNSRPEFSCPGFFRPGFFLPGFRHQLLHAFATGQERRNKPESSAAKLYCLHLLEPESKRARARKRTRTREQEREKKQECKREREQEQEQERAREWRIPVPFKENYPPPRTCRSLIGCSPSAELTSRGRQSTWSEEPPSAHAQIICLPLRTQLSAPSCNGECGRGSQHLPLSF